MIASEYLHLLAIALIIIIMGAFGGWMNHYHCFDQAKDDVAAQKRGIMYFIVLGIGAAILVPAFLKLISSDLIGNARKDKLNYFIIAGFCLVASVFSRRFISSIGEQILKKVEEAEKKAIRTEKKVDEAESRVNEGVLAAKEAKSQIVENMVRIEDLKSIIGSKNYNMASEFKKKGPAEAEADLLEIARNYITLTSIPDYSTRVKTKADLGRRMGLLININELDKKALLKRENGEGMLMGIAYSFQLSCSNQDLDILYSIAAMTHQLFTMYTITVAFDSLLRNDKLNAEHCIRIEEIMNRFEPSADAPLKRKIAETRQIINTLRNKGAYTSA